MSHQGSSRPSSAMAGEIDHEHEPGSRPQSRAESSAAGHLSRKNTLQKRMSLSRRSSTKRSALSRAGSVRSLSRQYQADDEDNDELYNPLISPVPTKSNPTTILADRFQAWRKLLKELVLYFREVASSYETKSKMYGRLQSSLPKQTVPSAFLSTGGLLDAVTVLDSFHRDSTAESNRAKLIQAEIIDTLTGLRHDLTAKIKEIKALSGDFKNTVDREMDHTRKAVAQLQDALGALDHRGAAASGRGDPFMVRLAVEKQVAVQLDEENYLHRAYLNLENSGRELESIVVGEIQKAFDNYAQILSAEADQQFEAVEKLKAGPLAMDKSYEWTAFVERDHNLIDPRKPLRSADDIRYAGKDHPNALEVKSGMLERKSKYLKSYTPGWYVLSSSYLHEFKSPDQLAEQQPVMSLYLPDQRLGSHSQAMSSSHKFILKGRQAGAMHRGHSWTFRAESHDTMLAWYGDLKKLTEAGSGQERDAFVETRNRHRRAGSGASLGGVSMASGGTGRSGDRAATKDGRARSVASSTGSINDEDEADQVPYSGAQAIRQPLHPATSDDPSSIPVSHSGGPPNSTQNHHPLTDGPFHPDPNQTPSRAHLAPQAATTRASPGSAQRPSPGGRFPSDLQVQRVRVRNLTISSSGESTVASGPAGPGVAGGTMDGSDTPPEDRRAVGPASTVATTVSSHVPSRSGADEVVERVGKEGEEQERGEGEEVVSDRPAPPDVARGQEAVQEVFAPTPVRVGQQHSLAQAR